jgi:hypothetical protein
MLPGERIMKQGKIANSRAGDWTFFATMSLVVAALVAWGFGPSYTRGLAPPGLPFWVHFHGAVMTAWILLFAVQAALVRRRSLPLHRTLGFASIGLVVVMLPLGMATNLLGIRRDAVPPFFTPEQVFAADLCDLLLFAGLYSWALVWRHRRDWHKRLMLGATILLSWPGIARIHFLGAFGLGMIIPLSLLVLVALALAGPLHDLGIRRRVHPAYLWSLGAVLILGPLYMGLATTALVHTIVQPWRPAQI